MILHPCHDEIAKRYAAIDADIRKGVLDLPRALSSYAYCCVAKDGGSVLALNKLDAARIKEATDIGSNGKPKYIPFIISTFEEDRDGDVVDCSPRACVLDNFAKNPGVYFGHQEWPVAIGTSRRPEDRAIAVWPEGNLTRAWWYPDYPDPDSDYIAGKVLREVMGAASIAFVPIQAVRRDEVEKARPRSQPMTPPGWFFKVYDLTEWSIVGVPSNAGAIRDSLDTEKSFISPRLQKALKPYAAKARGRCFSGWCSGPDCETKAGTGSPEQTTATNEGLADPPADLRWDVYIDDKFFGSELATEKQWVEELMKWRLKDVNPKPRLEVKGPYVLDDKPPKERWNKSLSNVFDADVKLSDSNEVQTATTFRVAAKFLSCQIKDLYSNSTMAPSCRLGSFLTGLKKALNGYRLVEVRNFGETHGGAQRESPPVFETVQCSSKVRDNFLVQGTMFLEGVLPVKRSQPAVVRKGSGPHNNYGRHSSGVRFLCKFEPTWNGLQVTVLTKQQDAALNQSIIDRSWAWAKENNFLKGEAFALSGEFLQRSDEGWDDVFLEAKNKKAVQRVLALFNEKQAEFANRGVILTGPPGTGKTLSGRIIRNQAKGTYIWISSKDFHNSGSVGGMSAAFELAKELAPSILFMEDVDNWLHPTTIDLLKTEMDGIARSKGVLTILTTNFPERLPDALIDRPGRFHDVLQFDLPSVSARKAMLSKWLPLASRDAIKSAVEKTHGYSGAHVYELAKFAEALQGHDGVPPNQALSEALEKVAEQRELITKLQLEGSNYNPLRGRQYDDMGGPMPRHKQKACSCGGCRAGKACCGAVEKAVKRRDVDEAAKKYQQAMSQYGENNMVTQRAEIAYRDLKDKWEQENGKKYGAIKTITSTQADIEGPGQQPGGRTRQQEPERKGPFFANDVDAALKRSGATNYKTSYSGNDVVLTFNDSKNMQLAWDALRTAKLNLSGGSLSDMSIRVSQKALESTTGTFGGYLIEPGKLQSDEGDGSELDDIVTDGWVRCDDCCDAPGNCPACDGTGKDLKKGGDCAKCKGSGDCPACDGIGQVPKPAKSVRKAGSNGIDEGEFSRQRFPGGQTAGTLKPGDKAEGKIVASAQKLDRDRIRVTFQDGSSKIYDSPQVVSTKQLPPAVSAIDDPQTALAKLYGHAKAQADYLDSFPDGQRFALQDYRDRAGEEMERIKAAFGQQFPGADFDQALAKAMESSGPQDTTEPGEAGEVESGRIPPETKEPQEPVPPAEANGTTKGANMARQKAAKESVTPGDATIIKPDADAAGELDSGPAEYNKDDDDAVEKGNLTDDIDEEGNATMYNKGDAPTGDPVEGDEDPATWSDPGTAVSKDVPISPDTSATTADAASCPGCGMPIGKMPDGSDAPFCMGCGGPVQKIDNGPVDQIPDPTAAPALDAVDTSKDDFAGRNQSGAPSAAPPSNPPPAADTSADTEEILQRYQQPAPPKGLVWRTRKMLVPREIFNVLKQLRVLRMTKSGQFYLIRKETMANLDTDDDKNPVDTVSAGEIIVSIKALEAALARLAGVKEFLAGMRKAADVPVVYKAGIDYSTGQLGFVTKALTDKGKLQRDQGGGDDAKGQGGPLDDKGRLQRNPNLDGGDDATGQGGPLKDKGELQADGLSGGEKPKRSKAMTPRISPEAQKEWADTIRFFRQVTGGGIKNGAGAV